MRDIENNFQRACPVKHQIKGGQGCVACGIGCCGRCRCSRAQNAKPPNAKPRKNLAWQIKIKRLLCIFIELHSKSKQHRDERSCEYRKTTIDEVGSLVFLLRALIPTPTPRSPRKRTPGPRRPKILIFMYIYRSRTDNSISLSFSHQHADSTSLSFPKPAGRQISQLLAGAVAPSQWPEGAMALCVTASSFSASLRLGVIS